MLYCISSLKTYEYPEYHHDHYFHNQPKNHTHIHLVYFTSYHQLKQPF